MFTHMCSVMSKFLPGPFVHEILQGGILEWVIISFSRGSSESRDQIYISWLAGSFFTTESPGKQSQLYRYKLILWPNLMNSQKKKKTSNLLCILF